MKDAGNNLNGVCILVNTDIRKVFLVEADEPKLDLLLTVFTLELRKDHGLPL